MPDKPYFLKWIPPGRLRWQTKSGIVVVPEGESILKVAPCRTEHIGTYRYFLTIDEKPLAIVDDLCPTCNRILQTGYAGKAEIDPWLAHIRKAVRDEDTCLEHLEAFLPIVSLFGRGVYSLGIVDYSLEGPDGKPSLWQFGKRRDPSGLAIGNGPWGPRYLEPLQPAEKADGNVVQTYADLIADGDRPVGIAYHLDGFLSLLLDGHHKALAYAEQTLEMPCLTIHPMGTVRNSNGKLLYWHVPGSHMGHDRHRIVKPRELPRDFVAQAKAGIAARRSEAPQYIDEETEERYLMLLGVSR